MQGCLGLQHSARCGLRASRAGHPCRPAHPLPCRPCRPCPHARAARQTPSARGRQEEDFAEDDQLEADQAEADYDASNSSPEPPAAEDEDQDFDAEPAAELSPDDDDDSEPLIEFDDSDFDFLDQLDEGTDDPAFASLHDGQAAYDKLAQGKRNLSAPEESADKDKGRQGPRSRDSRDGRDSRSDGFEESVLNISRVCKVVKGGRHVAFRADVVVGNQKGLVGVGCSSAKEVAIAIQKAVRDAKKNVVQITITKDLSFPHFYEHYEHSAKVMLRPAAEGTGVIAGGAVRVVLQAAGVKNGYGKQLGTGNRLNNARACVNCLKAMRTPRQAAKERGLSIEELLFFQPDAPSKLDAEEKKIMQLIRKR